MPVRVAPSRRQNHRGPGARRLEPTPNSPKSIPKLSQNLESFVLVTLNLSRHVMPCRSQTHFRTRATSPSDRWSLHSYLGSKMSWSARSQNITCVPRLAKCLFPVPTPMSRGAWHASPHTWYSPPYFMTFGRQVVALQLQSPKHAYDKEITSPSLKNVAFSRAEMSLQAAVEVQDMRRRISLLRSETIAHSAPVDDPRSQGCRADSTFDITPPK